MADETKRVEALYGPYAGTQLDLPAADAEAAIAAGWARDPFVPPPDEAEWTQEAHEKIIEAAEKAARKLRGEDEEETDVKAKKATADKTDDAKAKKTEADKAAADKAAEPLKTEDMNATDPKGYETRTTRKPK